jgi:hypothetical protein
LAARLEQLVAMIPSPPFFTCGLWDYKEDLNEIQNALAITAAIGIIAEDFASPDAVAFFQAAGRAAFATFKAEKAKGDKVVFDSMTQVPAHVALPQPPPSFTPQPLPNP